MAQMETDMVFKLPPVEELLPNTTNLAKGSIHWTNDDESKYNGSLPQSTSVLKANGLSPAAQGGDPVIELDTSPDTSPQHLALLGGNTNDLQIEPAQYGVADDGELHSDLLNSLNRRWCFFDNETDFKTESEDDDDDYDDDDEENKNNGDDEDEDFGSTSDWLYLADNENDDIEESDDPIFTSYPTCFAWNRPKHELKIQIGKRRSVHGNEFILTYTAGQLGVSDSKKPPSLADVAYVSYGHTEQVVRLPHEKFTSCFMFGERAFHDTDVEDIHPLFIHEKPISTLFRNLRMTQESQSRLCFNFNEKISADLLNFFEQELRKFLMETGFRTKVSLRGLGDDGMIEGALFGTEIYVQRMLAFEKEVMVDHEKLYWKTRRPTKCVIQVGGEQAMIGLINVGC